MLGVRRLAEATSLLQLMKSNVVSALRQYQGAFGSPDTHLAASMINNHRILANTTNLLLVLREGPELLA